MRVLGDKRVLKRVLMSIFPMKHLTLVLAILLTARCALAGREPKRGDAGPTPLPPAIPGPRLARTKAPSSRRTIAPSRWETHGGEGISLGKRRTVGYNSPQKQSFARKPHGDGRTGKGHPG